MFDGWADISKRKINDFPPIINDISYGITPSSERQRNK